MSLLYNKKRAEFNRFYLAIWQLSVANREKYGFLIEKTTEIAFGGLSFCCGLITHL
jgi:hypothetical protein